MEVYEVAAECPRIVVRSDPDTPSDWFEAEGGGRAWTFGPADVMVCGRYVGNVMDAGLRNFMAGRGYWLFKLPTHVPNYGIWVHEDSIARR